MNRMASKWFVNLEVTPKDIEIWHAKEGKFCSGCVEGKLKEHARKTSTKPLTATKPGGKRSGRPYVHLGTPWSEDTFLRSCGCGNKVNYGLRHEGQDLRRGATSCGVHQGATRVIGASIGETYV